MARKKELTATTKNQKAVLKKINYNVSGIDLSSEDMFIAVIDKDVKRFSAFTNGLEAAAKYLESERIEKIVMEATGVYWIPVYEYFEKKGFNISLVLNIMKVYQEISSKVYQSKVKNFKERH